MLAYLIVAIAMLALAVIVAADKFWGAKMTKSKS
jgi:hypothetical protein